MFRTKGHVRHVKPCQDEQLLGTRGANQIEDGAADLLGCPRFDLDCDRIANNTIDGSSSPSVSRTADVSTRGDRGGGDCQVSRG